MNVLDHVYGHPKPIEERAVASLAGGIASRGYQCGIIWGTALAAGAEAYRRWGSGYDAEARAVVAGRKVIDAFRAGAKNEIDCREITGMDFRQKTPLCSRFHAR